MGCFNHGALSIHHGGLLTPGSCPGLALHGDWHRVDDWHEQGPLAQPLGLSVQSEGGGLQSQSTQTGGVTAPSGYGPGGL